MQRDEYSLMEPSIISRCFSAELPLLYPHDLVIRSDYYVFSLLEAHRRALLPVQDTASGWKVESLDGWKLIGGVRLCSKTCSAISVEVYVRHKLTQLNFAKKQPTLYVWIHGPLTGCSCYRYLYFFANHIRKKVEVKRDSMLSMEIQLNNWTIRWQVCKYEG